METASVRAGRTPELAVAALVAAAALPLDRLFRPGPRLWVVVLGAVAGSVTVAWAMERLRTPLLVSAAASAAGFVWFCGFAFLSDTMLGPVPTPATVTGFAAALSDGLRASQVEVAPVSLTDPLLLLAAIGVWSTAWLVHDAVVRLRFPLLGVGLTLPLLLFPGALIPGRRHWLEGGAFLAAALWVVFRDHGHRLAAWGTRAAPGRTHAPGAALRVGVVATLAALAAAPLLPGYGGPPGLRGRSGGPHVVYNPLVSIRPSLHDDERRELFVVRSAVPTYMRLTALDSFDGEVWTAASERASLPVADTRVEPGASGTVRAIDQRVQIRSLGGPWLPVPFEPVFVTVPGAGMQPASRAVIAPSNLTRGLEYQVTAVLPAPSADEIDRAIQWERYGSLERYRQLPASMPPEVSEIARDVAGDEPTPYRQALALQRHLRAFTYNQDVAAGHDFSDLVTFLTEVREGYCEQFAAAMAVLARTLGMPARVAVGFGVGERDPVSPTLWHVTTEHAHAWVEIYFPGNGWLAFEPTPRSGVAVPPAYTVPEAEQTGRPEPIPTESDAPITAPTSRATRDAGAEEDDDSGATGGAGGGGIGAGRALVVLALVLVAAALAGPAFALARRSRRRRGAAGGRSAVAARYLDFLDWCAAAGLARRPAETPHEHAGRIGASPDGTDPVVLELADRAAGALWGGATAADPEGAAEASRAARSALTARMSRGRRAALALGWGWWRRDPGGANATAGPPAGTTTTEDRPKKEAART